MTKVILAVDDSDHSRGATDCYINQLHKAGNDVIVLHLQQPPFIPVHPVRAEVMDEQVKKSKAIGLATVESFRKRLQDSNITATARFEFSQKVGADVCEIARTEKVDYIIMGTRGLGKIRRTILGSVSDYVIHHAPCSVCVFRHK